MAVIEQLRWRAGIWSARLGVAGVIGIALAVLAPIAIVVDLMSTRAALSFLSAKTNADLNRSGLNALAIEPSTGQSVQQFEAMLPRITDVPGVLLRMREAAILHGVVLEEGQFKLSSESGSPISRYQMLFPAKAHYTQVREFLRDAMQANPTLALEQAALRRDDPNSEVIDTQIQFALYILTPHEAAYATASAQ